MKSRYTRLNDAELFQVFKGTAEEKREAFMEIYSRYSQKLYMYCLRMTGNADAANDVFQETFTRFFNHQFRDNIVLNLQAYLLTSARNVFLNSQRNTSRWSPFENDEFSAPTVPYEREELFNMVSSALELLDVPYREAFIFRFYQGLSYKEISEITGDSVASLKVRVMRAKDQIRHILSPYIADLDKY